MTAHHFPPCCLALLALAAGCVCSHLGQLQGQTSAVTPQRDGIPPADGSGFDGPPPFGPGPGGPGGFGPGGFGPPGFGPGGPPGMMGQDTKLVKQFDRDGDKRLNIEERNAARQFINEQRARRGGPGGRRGFGPGGPRGPGGNQVPPELGASISPADVKAIPDAALYDPATLRTIFIEFEDADWEKEMADFHRTDVDVPAKLIVDGKSYPGVGIHFHGASSFMMVPEGRKRSLNIDLDFTHADQQIGGYRSLILLNAHDDPSFLRTVLYLQVARDYLPAPKANFMRVVINGESRGIYVNAQHFDKEFVRDWFGTTKGARWKVPGSPNGRGNLAYLGDDPAAYKRIYEIKSRDDPKSWADLIRLCKVLNETPADQLEKALEPLLDVDQALKFLALENALINNDGYWIRTSDYSLYEDEKGRFHVFPHDANETFLAPGGPGIGGGPGRGGSRGFGGFRGRGDGPGPGFGGPPPDGPGTNAFAGAPNRRGGPGFGPGFGGPRINGVELDPLVAANDANKPLLSKLLAVPALRARYLGYVRDIAAKWLDWNRLGPVAQRYHDLIAEGVAADTRKLYSTDAFLNSLTQESTNRAGFGPGPGGPGGRTISLKSFADKRRAFILNYSESRKP